MPKYLDLEAHYEADMSAIFGIKQQANAPTNNQSEQDASELEREDGQA